MPLTLFRPSHSFSQSCPASCDQPQFEFVRFCTRLTGSIDVFVEVLARVKGKPSVGHTPPLHSDTVTIGIPPPPTPPPPPPTLLIVLYTPLSKVRHKDLARMFSASLSHSNAQKLMMENRLSTFMFLTKRFVNVYIPCWIFACLCFSNDVLLLLTVGQKSI